MRFVKRSIRVIDELSRIPVYPLTHTHTHIELSCMCWIARRSSRKDNILGGTPVSRHFARYRRLEFYYFSCKVYCRKHAVARIRTAVTSARISKYRTRDSCIHQIFIIRDFRMRRNLKISVSRERSRTTAATPFENAKLEHLSFKFTSRNGRCNLVSTTCYNFITLEFLA